MIAMFPSIATLFMHNEAGSKPIAILDNTSDHGRQKRHDAIRDLQMNQVICGTNFDSGVVVGMRGSGLKSLLEGVAYPMFGTQAKGRTALLQGGTATSERIARLLTRARQLKSVDMLSAQSALTDGRTVIMTALRHPVDRIVNR